VDAQNQDIFQTISLGALAVVGLVVGVQKLVRDWRSTQAESNIIQVMHTEIERMSDQNTKLSTEIGKLQEEIIRLNQELTKLNVENNKLQTEISRLTIELGSFKRSAEARGAE
jgi:septal ring factor EnvC (AmiA/AmiB activator)